MMNIKRFHPGVYIKDSLEAIEMTSKEFSLRTGISERTLSAIINGKGDITFDVAYKLAEYFDNSINYWTNLQNQYDLYLKENERLNEINSDWELVKSIKKYLLDYNYITSDDTKETIIIKARKLAGVNRLSLLNTKDSFVCFKEAHLKNENNYFIQNFWLALALTEARKKNGIPYDKKKLLASIEEIRGMTVKDAKDFYPRLQELLTDCGVSFVILPYMTKSNIFGATKWFSKENVMLAVSNRGEKADLFWFTLFHEISHVLMEHRRETLLNTLEYQDDEADTMAADLLISRNDWNNFINKKDYTIESINSFALKINILPCIILGRLHKENIIPYGSFDKTFNKSYHF